MEWEAKVQPAVRKGRSARPGMDRLVLCGGIGLAVK